MSDHYSILGVPRDASPEAIRSAYIALMKAHHPDSAPDPAAAARATEINRAFSVLRDPEARARYDRDLAQAERPAAHYPVHVPRQHLRPVPRIGSFLVKLLVLAVPAVLGFWLYGQLPDREAPPPPPVSEGGEAAAGGDVSAPSVRREDVRDGLSDYRWAGLNGGTPTAVAFSRRCFQGMETEPSYARADRCIAFDLAWERRRTVETRGETPETAEYFTQHAIEARHRGALERLGGGGAANDARLRELDSLTLSEMARHLSPSPEPPPRDKAVEP